jgi:hypothetical protein
MILGARKANRTPGAEIDGEWSANNEVNPAPSVLAAIQEQSPLESWGAGCTSLAVA